MQLIPYLAVAMVTEAGCSRRAPYRTMVNVACWLPRLKHREKVCLYTNLFKIKYKVHVISTKCISLTPVVNQMKKISKQKNKRTKIPVN